MAKIVVYRLLASLSDKYASLHLKNVVDDISLQMVGTARMIVNQLGQAGMEFAEGIANLRLPLSVAKTVFVASSREVKSTRNLGTEATAGHRRATAIADARLGKAKATTKKLL
eukprot:7380728-Karenia_brevis.AAC.1